MACLRVIEETFLSETSRFYCISGALRGLGFQNFQDSPPRRLIPLAFATLPPRSENASAVPGHRMTSHIFYDFTASRSSREPPSGKFSSTALGAAIVIY